MRGSSDEREPFIAGRWDPWGRMWSIRAKSEADAILYLLMFAAATSELEGEA